MNMIPKNPVVKGVLANIIGLIVLGAIDMVLGDPAHLFTKQS